MVSRIILANSPGQSCRKKAFYFINKLSGNTVKLNDNKQENIKKSSDCLNAIYFLESDKYNCRMRYIDEKGQSPQTQYY